MNTLKRTDGTLLKSTDLLAVLSEMKDYIESTEETIDGEWGACRNFDEIHKAGKVTDTYDLICEILAANVDVDTPASAGCVPRLVRLFGFLFGACCWIGFPLILLGLPTVYLFGMSGGNWFTWSFYALSWVVALVWWFLCFRWGPTREFIETYADRPNDGKPRNY